MTPAQIEAAIALEKCTFLPGSYEKKFARGMAAIATSEPGRELTDKQLAYLEKLLHRYRRQLGGLYHHQRVRTEPRPDPGSVVLGGQERQPDVGSVVLGSSK